MLWVKTQPVVWAYILSSVRDHHHAEDVLQQVAQQAAAKFDEYDDERPFTAWAIGIARNKIREYFRANSRDKLVFSEKTLEVVADSFAEQGEFLSGFRQALSWCLSQLNDKARELLGLRYMSDLKPATIAEQSGVSANTVRIRLHRYRSSLSECVSRRIASEEHE